MPRCYMVKKNTGKLASPAREVWVEKDPPGPASPTEACVAPPYYSPESNEAGNEFMQEFAPSNAREYERISIHGRTPEETEAAHDLLSLSQSLPPLTAPGVLTILQPVAYTYAPQSPELHDISPSCPLTAPAPTLTLVSAPCDYSSDAENDNPNSGLSVDRIDIQDIDEAAAVDSKSSAVYTYDALLVTDGRSKNKTKRESKKSVSDESSTYSDGEETGSCGTEGGDTGAPSRSGRYSCSECGKRYATSSNLSRHKQTHRSLDSVAAKKCMTCGKAYVSMPALAMHVLTHKLAHVCGVCGKLFSRPWLLQGHLRSHTGEKPYGCAHCGKAFADRSNLRAHMQTHSADKNFACARCHKSFALKSYLNKHLESACIKDGDGDEDTIDVE